MHLAVIMLFAFSQYGACSPLILFPYAVVSVSLTAFHTEKPATPCYVLAQLMMPT